MTSKPPLVSSELGFTNRFSRKQTKIHNLAGQRETNEEVMERGEG